MSEQNSPIQIAVVGDVHDQWETADELALKHLGVDLVLFVGDFGNESVEVVEQIASLDLPKAAVLGNHDAWYSASEWGRKKCPYNREQEDRVQQQLDLLGQAHVGYGKQDFPSLGLSVVGSRPFSWGGPEWKNQAFYRDRYGVNNFEQSTAKILAAAHSTTCDRIIFLGHNGPFGLGAQPEDACGRDWKPTGGDHGDPDLAQAITQVRSDGKAVPLVAFGHMHHRLRHTQERQRTAVVVAPGEETIYLNAACVPRIIEQQGDRLRNFSLVSLAPTGVLEVSLVWLHSDLAIAHSTSFYRRQASLPLTACP